MEQRFTILALQNGNFRRMPDGLQVISGRGWGASAGGTVGAKRGERLRWKLKYNGQHLTKQPIYLGIISSDIKDAGISPAKSAFLYTDHIGNYLGFLRIFYLGKQAKLII
jgi:hypothetical protein